MPTPQPQPGVQKPSAASQQVAAAPSVDGFKIKGSLKGTMKDLIGILRTVSFLEVAPEKDAVNAVYVESRDINKAPYLFSILKIKEDGIELVYSVPPEVAPKKRRLDMIRYLLNILALMENYYKVDNKVIYMLIENAVKEITEAVTLEYSKLYTIYDTQKKDIEDLRRRLARVSEENQALATKNFELKNRNDEMLLRLNELESYSDDTLKIKIQEWVAEHNGEINIAEFSKTFKVNETRVEQMLNRLVSEGYLETVA